MQHQPSSRTRVAASIDQGLACVAVVASYYRIPADPIQLTRELALEGQTADYDDLLRSVRRLGLRGRVVTAKVKRLAALPVPAVVGLMDGSTLR